MEERQFQKNKENFICAHCGAEVIGSGYTNHCPKCLWSKHVDINPGDRAATCDGLMKPIDIEEKRGDQVLIQKCLKCKHIRKNKIQDIDDIDVVLKFSQEIAEEKYLQ